MIRHTLWSDSVFEHSFPEVDTNQLVHEYQDFRRRNGTGVVRSNIGGWQGELPRWRYSGFDELYSKLELAATDIYYNVFNSDSELRIANGWLNVNGKSHSNGSHTHPGSHFCGVFYIQTSGIPEIGNITFTRSEGHCIATTDTEMEGVRDKDPQWRITSEFTPQQNVCYFFPPWLSHCVSPNITDDERIILAFNFIKGSSLKDLKQSSCPPI